MSATDAIADFWQFWAGAKDAFAASFRTGEELPELVTKMGERVAAIDPRLDWEFGPGYVNDHHLALSGKGDPRLRVLTEQWLARAPDGGSVWEFYAARQPHSSQAFVLVVSGHEITLDGVVGVARDDETRERLDVTIHHPAFASMADDKLKSQVAYIALDALLGEDGVERWVGAVDTADAPPEGALSFSALREHALAFSARATGQVWVDLEDPRDGGAVAVTLNAAVKRIDHPLADAHLSVTMRVARPEDASLSQKSDMSALESMQQTLSAALGAHAVAIAHETIPGARTLHFHVAAEGPARMLVDAWRARYPSVDISVAVAGDPAWEILDRWG
ncbi:MAG: DUF695 domain-containing protein [Polyangiaceae bacterium]